MWLNFSIKTFQKDMAFCVREKDWYIDIKSVDKESTQKHIALLLLITQCSFIHN